jgi:hypothetical protein
MTAKEFSPVTILHALCASDTEDQKIKKQLTVDR